MASWYVTPDGLVALSMKPGEAELLAAMAHEGEIKVYDRSGKWDRMAIDRVLRALDDAIQKSRKQNAPRKGTHS